MKVISVNIGERRKVEWRQQIVETGIFKSPVDKINLGIHDVENDHVVDRRFHGGVDKACYLFSADTYDFWKSKYSDLDWQWGMFGENVTVEGLDESDIFIGSTYSLGSAVVEVSEPRQPCFKLGIRFATQAVLKDFISKESSGVYVRMLKSGEVKPGDEFRLIEKGSDISIKDVFQLLYKRHKNPDLREEAIALEKLAEGAKRGLRG
ncbi:MAG: MOSC domain-containing protein [Cyclobacteriaceae bacterium]